MRSLLRLFARTSIVALTIALILSASPTPTFAAGPSVSVTGSGTGTCDGRPVASVVQGQPFDVSLSDFPIPVGGGVNVTFTLPDGRIRGPDQLGATLKSLPFPSVPAIGSYVALTTPEYKPGPLISASFNYMSLLSWPTGCYVVTASQAVAPGETHLTASAQFMLLPLPHNAQAGNLKLWVQAVGTSQANGPQPAPGAATPTLVNIFGQGVPPGAELCIHIVQPNGAIDAVPPAVVKQGTFNVPKGYAFTNLHQPGMHTIYATVTIPSPIPGGKPVIYTVKAQFNLTAPAITPTNNASLEMLAPFSALVPQVTPMNFQARKFSPAGPVGITLILPNGVRLTPPPFPYSGAVAVDANGNATIPAFALGGGFPTGTYTLVATQATPVARTALTSWRLIANP